MAVGGSQPLGIHSSFVSHKEGASPHCPPKHRSREQGGCGTTYTAQTHTSGKCIIPPGAPIQCRLLKSLPPYGNAAAAGGSGTTSVPICLCLPSPGYFWRISASPSSLRAGDILALAHPCVSEP